MKKLFVSMFCSLAIVCSGSGFIEPPLTAANVTSLSFDQRIGERLSSGIAFTNEDGRKVSLKECFSSGPVIVALGYYECPMLCNLVLNGLVQSLQEIKPESVPGLSVVFVSIDPKETVDLAAAKKRTYLKRLGRSDAARSWHFLTGSSSSIRQLAGEIGFHYAYDAANRQYAHPSGIVVLTPGGRISKYFFGVNYSAADLAEALKQAAAGESGKPSSPFLMLCSKFMTLTGKYSAAVIGSVRALGVLSIFGVIMLVVVSGRRPKGDAT